MEPRLTDPIFDDEGAIRLGVFADDARGVLVGVQEWLERERRRVFLPLDLLIVMIERGHVELEEMVAEAGSTDEEVGSRDVLSRLKGISREIDESPEGGAPRLRRDAFSRGFTRILREAWEQALGRRRSVIGGVDLARSLIWRVEAVESASVRWAIRRLGEGRGDELFEEDGLLREGLFRETTWEILQGAMKIAAAHGTPFLGTPHLVAMLCSVKDSTIWRASRARGLQPGRLRKELLRLIGSKPGEIPGFLLGRKTLTPRMIRMLAQARRRASGQNVAEVELVEAFIEDGGSSLELVRALGLEAEIAAALGEPRVLEDVLPVEAAVRFASTRPSTPTLDTLGRDLTAEALDGRLPEIVGREDELDRVLNVLLRREQRNPLLTGEAGVGKTALAVGLAQRISTGRVPKMLRGHRVVELNGASLLGGTSYRGDLEARIASLLEEASKDVILFIDEAHAVFAPRSGSQTPAEVPNHFKRALASGEIAVLGATTEAEYRRWFEQDPALKRRFERVEVAEPGASLVEEILRSAVSGLESDYEVRVEGDAITAAVELSVRYMPEQRLPDKAKKLLMDACIARATGLVSRGLAEKVVTRADIADQVAVKTGVPIERMLQGEHRWWEGIAGRLKRHVVGQSRAIEAVARALVAGRLRRGEQRRPLSVLLFVGPAGVGRASLAEAIAAEVFHDPRAVHRLDMSDLQESHSISRLIGSPPGYVGYADEDSFVTPLRRRPSAVVLLENFDLAHPSIQERILRLLDEGEIVDTRGGRADVSHAIFVLTVSAEVDAGRGPIGFSGRRAGAGPSSVALDALDGNLAKRLEGVVDAAIPFFSLAGDDDGAALEMLDRRVVALIDAVMKEYELEVRLDEVLRGVLNEEAMRARQSSQINRIVEERLLEPLTEALLTGEITGRRATLRWREGGVEVLSGVDANWPDEP